MLNDWRGFLWWLAMMGIAVLVIAAIRLVTLLRRSQADQQRTNQKLSEVQALLDDSLAQLDAIHRVANSLSQAIELPELLGEGLEEAVAVLGLDGGQIFLVQDDKEHSLHLSNLIGHNIQNWAHEHRVEFGECICGQAATQDEPIVVDDVANDPRVTGRACARGGIPSLASVPLRSKDNRLGVLTVRSCDPHHFVLNDVRLLTTLGTILSASLENARIRAGMEERIQKLTTEVRQLAILQERERISREMHDGLAQTLGLLNIQIEAVKAALDAENIAVSRDEVSRLDGYIGNTYTDVREALGDLRDTSPQGEAFIASLRESIRMFGRRNGIETSFHIAYPDNKFCIPPLMEIELRRTLQEALANVRQHASAEKVDISITNGMDGFKIVVVDDGVGFDVQRFRNTRWQKYGLLTMQERMESLGGSFSVQSEPGVGTQVILLLPRNSTSDWSKSPGERDEYGSASNSSRG